MLHALRSPLHLSLVSPWTASFRPDDHQLIFRERFHAHVTETRFAHPADAIRSREVEPAGRHHQHVQAREQASGICAPLVVDQPFVDDERAARGKRLIGLREQHFLGRKIPIVKHPAHDQHIGVGNGSRKKSPGWKLSRSDR